MDRILLLGNVWWVVLGLHFLRTYFLYLWFCFFLFFFPLLLIILSNGCIFVVRLLARISILFWIVLLLSRRRNRTCHVGKIFVVRSILPSSTKNRNLSCNTIWDIFSNLAHFTNQMKGVMHYELRCHPTFPLVLWRST